MTAGSTPGFYHYSVPSTDTSAVAQQQSGWILVGNPGATFTKTGDEQKAKTGSQISLSVTLNPGQSGGTVLFTTSAGMLSSRMVTTDSTGRASGDVDAAVNCAGGACDGRGTVCARACSGDIHRNRQ